MDYIRIDNKADLRSYLQDFAESRRYIMAVDIEAESNLHAYGEKLCLIQVFDGVNQVITHTLVMRSSSGTVRWIKAEHQDLDKFVDAIGAEHRLVE